MKFVAKRERRKNPAAVVLGRRGGKARAIRLPTEELSRIGKRGAQARWNRRFDNDQRPARATQSTADPGRDAMAERAKEATSTTIREMVRRIVERVHPERVVLFGSYAAGSWGPDSDVDLLVVLSKAAAKRPIVTELYRLLAGMGLPKDIVVVTLAEIERFQDVPGTIVRSALQQGKVLYERTA